MADVPKTITQDGHEYILKSTTDSIISSRISAYAAKIAERDQALATLQAQFDEQTAKLATTEQLQQRINTLETDLQSANTRYDRHSALAGLGVNDESVRGVFEHIYSTMQVEEGQAKPKFADWVNGFSANPDNAPAALKPFLPKQEQQQQQQPKQEAQQQEQRQPRQAPDSNNGVVSLNLNGMQPQQFLDRAAYDSGFYAANRDTIIKLQREQQTAKSRRV